MTAAQPSVDYFTNPLETWTLRDFRDALGLPTIAQLWGTSRAATAMVFTRNRCDLARLQALQDAVRDNEPYYRSTLVTIRSNHVTSVTTTNRNPSE